MSTLNEQFEQAVADSKNLSERPDNMTMLKIYALYKQASAGDVDGKRPGFTDMVGRAKWDAWNELKGQSSDEAKLGFMFRPFLGMIEAETRKQLDEVLAKESAKDAAKGAPKAKAARPAAKPAKPAAKAAKKK